MKDYIKPTERLSPCKRYRVTVDDLAWCIVGVVAFMLITAVWGLGYGLGAVAVFGSGVMVKRHLDKKP